jgi:hypothetical protein
MKAQKFARGTLVAAAALVIGASGAQAADYVLKYGHPGPVGPDSDDHVAGEFYIGRHAFYRVSAGSVALLERERSFGRGWARPEGSA